MSLLTTNHRIKERNKWAVVGMKMANNNNKTKGTTRLQWGKNMRIENDLSDFMEKLDNNNINGCLTLLKEVKGTFGFPYLTRIADMEWFTKIIVYNLDVDEVSDEAKEGRYRTLPPARVRAVHRELQNLRNYSINTEPLVHAILTDLVLQRVTPHVCMLYGVTELNQAKHQPVIRGLIDRFKRKNQDDFVDMAKVLMTEWANQGDLCTYIRRHKRTWTIETWRGLLFQMLAMLALVQEKIPSFRHNDLSLSNILVQETTIQTTEMGCHNYYYKYRIGEHEYVVPDIGFRVLMADFDYASIEAQGITNDKLNTETTRKFGTIAHKNASFDCHMMLNWLNMHTLKLYKPAVVARGGAVLEQVKAFVDSVLDQKYQGNTNRWLKYSRFRFGQKEITALTPAYILHHNTFFDPFRQQQQQQHQVSSMELECFNF